jgi:DNA-nicking Smr family endonuclease
MDKFGQLVDDKTNGRVFPKADKLREQAQKAYDRYVECAKDAQNAWQSHDHKKAHEFSVAKGTWKKKSDSLHAAAAQCIIDNQSWRGSRRIDLHGLFVAEAKDIVENVLEYFKRGAERHGDKKERIEKAKQEKRFEKEKARKMELGLPNEVDIPDGCVEIITGAGHHSTDHARIRPMVEQLLKEKNLKYDMERGGGAILVHLFPVADAFKQLNETKKNPLLSPQ